MLLIDAGIYGRTEKAGVGGSTPSLATRFSITYLRPKPQFCSVLFQKFRPAESLPQQLAELNFSAGVRCLGRRIPGGVVFLRLGKLRKNQIIWRLTRRGK